MKRRCKRIAVLLCLVLLGTLLLTSCKRGGSDKRGIRIYYLNMDGTALQDKAFTPKADTTEGIITELLGKLCAPPEDLSLKAPISDFSLLYSAFRDGMITLDVSEEYYDLPVIREVLTRTAIVNTLCSFSGIRSVGITVRGEPLADADGVVTGQMTTDQFIYNTDTEMRNYEKVRLHLYFANESGDRLVDTYRNVVYNSNMPMERLIVEQVIQGTDSGFAYPTLNSETKVLSVTTRDNICYVNLDRSFLSEPYKVTPEVAVYSLVNSLTEMQGIDVVQISVDGQTDVVFMESLSLGTAFRRNDQLVLGGGTFGQDE